MTPALDRLPRIDPAWAGIVTAALAALKNRVLNVWNRTARGARKDNEQWDVAVFDTDDVNAFVHHA